MQTQHRISSGDYITGLKFDYIETYSFQRGEEYESELQIIRKEYEQLKVKKEQLNNLTALEEERFSELAELTAFTQYLINKKGEFHPSSTKKNRFHFDDSIVSRLIEILKTEVKEVPYWMCAPTYRDAIVFYDTNNKIVSVLNVCLSCQYMETQSFHHIKGDYVTYDLLKRFFLDIGHEVENPTQFVLDEMKELREYHKRKVEKYNGKPLH